MLNCNIIDKDNTIKIIKETLEIISSCLSNTLGPMGCNTIIEDTGVNHTITKDGYTVYNNIRFENEISKIIYDLIKKISRNQVREVGDGSTSAILVACELYSSLLDTIHNNQIPSKIIILMLNKMRDILKELILEKAIKVNKDNSYDVLRKVATISNNNDEELGKFIAEIYTKIGKDGFINLEISKSKNDYVEYVDGYEYPYGYIGDFFIDGRSSNEWISEEPLVFICNDAITEEDLPLLQDILGNTLRNKKSIVLVAKEYSTDVYNFLKVNKQHNREALQVCAITVPLINENDYCLLDDFSIYTGCKIYDKHFDPDKMDEVKDYREFLGQCEKAIISDKTSKFIKGNYIERDYTERIKFLVTSIAKLKLDVNSDDTKLFDYQKRLSKLKCKIASIYVGGYTDVEKKNRRYLIEDSIYACKSVLENGYVIGGNLTIPFIMNEKSNIISEELYEYMCSIYSSNKTRDEKMSFIYTFIDCVYVSFKYTYYKVLYNYSLDENIARDIVNESISSNQIFNLIKNRYEGINNTDIINSVNTDIEIMNSAFSIIGLLITSNQFVTRSIISKEKLEEALGNNSMKILNE